MSNSSLSSFFSASPGTRDSMSDGSGDSPTESGSSVNSFDSSVSDTIRNSATVTPTSSLSSVSETFLTSSMVSNPSNLLSVSLSLNTIGSGKSSVITIPPCPTKSNKRRVETLVDLKSSPFVRGKKFAFCFPDEQEEKPVVTTPTPARLRSLMKEKLYIGGWVNQIDGRYIPEHIPWEFEDAFAPMPWIPEGSIVSKSRFHEIRREQRPRSYSPPPTPPAAPDVPPLDALPFPALVPTPTEGPTLKRAASFHPGGSQKLRREALVIDGKVTIDTGFKLRSRSYESIASSSFGPTDMDLVVRQLNSGHQSGLERLKNSVLRLMGGQSHTKVAKSEELSGLSPTVGPCEPGDELTGPPFHNPLAARRGQQVPSALRLVVIRSPPLLSPYHPEIPSPFRGSPSAVTPLFNTTGASNRESIGIEDMCTNLRQLVSPLVSDSFDKDKEDVPPSQSYCTTTDQVDRSDGAIGGPPRSQLEDWNFASELEGVFDSDPFPYFNSRERIPSFIRPLSVTPDIVTESVETQRSSGSSAASVSTFPEPPTDILTAPPVSYIPISEDRPTQDLSPIKARASPSPSVTTSSEGLLEGSEVSACNTSSSTGTSPRSSEDKDVPLAFRRLTLLARCSTMFNVEEFHSSGNLQSLVQGAFKPVTKAVRFASETEEHIRPGNLEVSSSCGVQRDRSSSAPPTHRGSIIDRTFANREKGNNERLSRSQPTILPSRIPQKTAPTRNGEICRRPVAGQRDALTQVGLGNGCETKKNLSSLIPVAGLKYTRFPVGQEKVDGGKRGTGRSDNAYISLKQPRQITTLHLAHRQQKPLLTASWSTTLKQYVKGGDTSGEKRQIPHSQHSKHRGESSPPQNSSTGAKSLLPVKKVSFFRDGTGRANPLGGAHNRTKGRGRAVGGGDDLEGDHVIGLVDKTGGISYIAPPKVKEMSRSQGRVKGGRLGPSTTGTRTLRPVQIRNFLGRFAA